MNKLILKRVQISNSSLKRSMRKRKARYHRAVYLRARLIPRKVGSKLRVWLI